MSETPDFSVNNENDAMIIDDKTQNLSLLTQKVDEELESQMKNIEIQKIEDELTIKKLEREYSESKKSFMYSKRKLDETRKKVSTQSETIDQLSQANKAIVEKFNELKNFQQEVILVNINNAEKMIHKCINKNNVLSNTFETIIEKDNYYKCLNKNIANNKKKANSDIQRYITEKKAANDNLHKLLIQLHKQIEILRIESTREKASKNLNELIEPKNRRITELETDFEAFKTQFNQKIDELTQNKIHKIQLLDINEKNLKERRDRLSQLESELISTDQRQTTLNESLQIAQIKYEDIFNKVMKARENNELSKKTHDENIQDMNNEQEKINDELQNRKNKFHKDENDMHTEFNNLLSKLDEKKKLLQKMEGFEQNLEQLRETKQTKQKELTNNKVLQMKLKKSDDELAKYEQTLLMKNKKQNELALKIKDLYSKKNTLEQKLSKFDENTKNNFVDKFCKINITNSQTDKKTTQSTEFEKNMVYSKNGSEQKSNSLSNTPQSVKNVKPEKSPSIYSFDISDESDEDLMTPRKSQRMDFKSHEEESKKVYEYDEDDERNANHSQSEKLFDDLLSQKSPSPSKTSKDTDFKMPYAYQTPFRKKPIQSRNTFKNMFKN